MNSRNISLAQAQDIVRAALSEGRRLGLRPLSVAVLDAGGHMVAFAREDGSSNLRQQIATGKAYGALSLGMPSRAIAEMAAERPAFINAAAQMSSGGMIPAAGGLLIRDGVGALLGAVGVTGDSSENDEGCAAAGVTAARLSC